MIAPTFGDWKALNEESWLRWLKRIVTKADCDREGHKADLVCGFDYHFTENGHVKWHHRNTVSKMKNGDNFARKLIVFLQQISRNNMDVEETD